MLYCFAELRNYRQLTRLRAAILPSVESGLTAVFESRKLTVSPLGQGAWIAEMGMEEDFDAGGASAVLLKALDFLQSRRQDLFGFSLLVSGARPDSKARLAEMMRESLRDVEESERLWITAESAPLFAEVLALAPEGGLRRVTGPVQEPEAPLPAVESPRPWIREALVGRAMDVLAERLNSSESRLILHLHGPPGAGKTTLLREVSRRVLGGKEFPVLRTHTLFKRRSPLHPFLNSLTPSFLPAVPKHLVGVERAAWADVSGLLSWLLRSEDAADARLHPDHVMEDFVLGYRLCMTAWLRMAAQRGLPALFLCEGVDSYHSEARRIAARLVSGFLDWPDFLPVLSSASAALPEELTGLSVGSVNVHPLGSRELRSLSRHLYPGVALPEILIRRLRNHSSGVYLSAVSYLQYLQKAGRIRFSPAAHEWFYQAAPDAVLPANPLSASWYLLRALPEDAFVVLYALQLASGLLDRRAFTAFLADAGVDQKSAERALAGLASAGLVAEEDTLIPRFPVLRRKLEEALGVKGIALRERFVTYMSTQWEAGKYPHHVLLFSFLARNGRTDLALRVLPELIRRKLDEGDIAGGRAFFEVERLEFSTAPTQAQRVEMEALAAIGRLRAALLEGNREAAESARAAAAEVTRLDAAGDLRGEARLELTKHSLSRGDSTTAMDEVKRAMLLYQEPHEGRVESERHDAGERASYLWLGVTMLADGKLSEAVEYVGLSERLCQEAGDAPGTLLAETYLGICHFMEGRYSQARAAADRSIAGARALCRREAEMFLLFLKARILFQLGSFGECCSLLQSCLCLAELYSVTASVPVLQAWLARAMLHRGEAESGLRILQQLEPTREQLFFLAEGFLFTEALESASPCLDRALALEDSGGFPFPEAVSWRDGFASIEGRCFRLSRGGAFFRRNLTALRACVLGLRGFKDEGIQELHKLTRSERSVGEDPNGFWYNYLYAMVLPQSGSHEFDDRDTILGKALKSLQERASRIDAPADRSSFLSANRWNRRIMDEARERKLI